MKHKILLAVLSAAAGLCLVCGLAACGGTGGGETTRVTEGFSYEYDKETDTYAVAGIGTVADGAEEIAIAIPDSYEGKRVTAIGKFAFYGCEASAVEIPDGVTSIGNSAFESCTGLTDIVIPDSVSSVGGWAFAHCKELTSAKLGSGLKEIGVSMFEGCTELTGMTIPDGVTSVKEDAFDFCVRLESIVIPVSVTSVGAGAFAGCGLNAVYYRGSAQDWAKIAIEDNGNDDLFFARIFFFTEDAPTAEEWASHADWWYYNPETSAPAPWTKDPA